MLHAKIPATLRLTLRPAPNLQAERWPPLWATHCRGRSFAVSRLSSSTDTNMEECGRDG